MGRNRTRKADLWMPRRVYRGRSAYEYRPKGGGCIRLCPLDAPKSAVMAEYERATANPHGDTLSALWDAYSASDEYDRLRPDTKRAYGYNVRALAPVFWHVKVRALATVDLRKYMDLRGRKSKSAANHELALLRTLLGWGWERGWVDRNVAKPIKAFREPGRDRYVTDEEYLAVYDAAPPMMRAAMEIAYLCGMRRADVLSLTRWQLKDEGIYVRQSKTGKAQVKAWTPRLRAAVNLALEQSPERAGEYVIRTVQGGRYRPQSFSTLFGRVVRRAAEAGGFEPFPFHDLKAKGVSDYSGDNVRRFSGHLTEAMAQRYRRKTEVSPTLGADEASEYPPRDGRK